MPCKIEDYALLGDCQTAALVGLDGSIDWLCLPRFDSGACFAALLGNREHGRWLLKPVAEVRKVRRHYRDNTLVLETEYETTEGIVTVIDFMPLRGKVPDLVRIVVGKRGKVSMEMEAVFRFDYGSFVPWVRRTENGILAIAGPDMVRLSTPIELKGEGFTTIAKFTISEGQRVPFVLTWSPSHVPPPAEVEPEIALQQTEQWWRQWAALSTYKGPYQKVVVRSLITLKALTYAPTGGIVAAPTTSLPEQLGGGRNWDYRYCWLRDATFTLYALINAGYTEEASSWRDWLLRAIAGKPEQMQIMYGIAGERRLTELSLDWLPGYEGAHPVRIGNDASRQFQLDVYGEVMDALYLCRRVALPSDDVQWRLESSLVSFLESCWQTPDDGIWEVRGPRRHFTYSKVMAWVALDRAVKSIEQFGQKGPLERWHALREGIHKDICEKGFDATLGSFVQYYGSKTLDASLLMIPLVGFLEPSDPRVRGTVKAIEDTLMVDGLVIRYPTTPDVDGLPPGEGVFLACSFWLADNYVLLGRLDDARRLFERLLLLCNDVGLLSEEYDPSIKRLVGNFPQAFSHIALINTARNLSDPEGPAEHRPTA